MQRNKVHHVHTVGRVARDLGVDEDLIHELTLGLDPENGVIWVYGVDDGELIDLTKTMLRDAWDQRSAEAERGQDEVRKQLTEIERTTQGLLDRIIEATSPAVISLCEKRIEQLEREKIVLKEQGLENRAPARAFPGLY